MKNIIYYKQLLKLIESLQDEKIYPKKYTNNELKHELSNLYVSWLLTNSSIDKKDKNFLITGIMPNIVTNIVQSIFYDSLYFIVEDWNEETNLLGDFLQLLYFIERQIQYALKELEKCDNNIEEKTELSTFIISVQKEIQKILIDSTIQNLEHLWKQWNDIIMDYSIEKIRNILSKSIDQIIQILQQIPKNLWYNYLIKDSKKLSNYLYRLLTKLVKTTNKLRQKMGDIVDKIKKYHDVNLKKCMAKPFEELNDILSIPDDLRTQFTFGLSEYFSIPYYNAIYNGILPLYNKFKIYLLNPTKNTFENLLQQIDHIKDLHHHSNFFWASLKRDTMDFISNAPIDKLIQYVTDPDIKRIYKKYYLMMKNG